MKTNEVRRKIATILFKIKYGYGYQIYKYYRKIFGNISLRTFYYNLNKGEKMREFVIVDIKKVNGSFTWGDSAQRVYYMLGPMFQMIDINERIGRKLEELPTTELDINIEKEKEKMINELKLEREKAIQEKDVKKMKIIEEIGNKLKSWPPHTYISYGNNNQNSSK